MFPPVAAIAAALAFGQSPGPVPSFEVASVKPSPSGSRGPMLQIEPGGRFTATGITLRNLITLAYHVRDEQLHGAPSWIESARYDIDAKPSGRVGAQLVKEEREQQFLRLQSLLADRFELRVHRQAEQRTVLFLIVAKGGPKLEQAAGRGASCKPSTDGPGLITTMEMLASDFSGRVGEPVEDHTGLKGFFCVRLRWTADDGRSHGLGIGLHGDNPGGPSIYSAIQQQLGLKLQAEKGPVQVLVVDHIARPRPN